jgi:RNA polymerase sigma-70 factor (ECF subfamily)
VPLPLFFRRPRASVSGSADARALELVRAELPRVERLLGRMLGPRADLEDLVQNVFVEACRAFAHYRAEGSPGAFVGGIAVRVARRAMRGTAFSRHRAELEVEPASAGLNPEDAYAQSQQLRLLRLALDKLAPKKRIAFTLWALEGLEPQEIAQLTEASLSATRSRIFYAQKELRALAERSPALREALGVLS